MCARQSDTLKRRLSMWHGNAAELSMRARLGMRAWMSDWSMVRNKPECTWGRSGLATLGGGVAN